MIADGYTGRKGKGGFYRLNREEGQAQGSDRPDDRRFSARSSKPSCRPSTRPARICKSCSTRDSAHGRYAWDVMGATLAYAAALVPRRGRRHRRHR